MKSKRKTLTALLGSIAALVFIMASLFCLSGCGAKKSDFNYDGKWDILSLYDKNYGDTVRGGDGNIVFSSENKTMTLNYGSTHKIFEYDSITVFDSSNYSNGDNIREDDIEIKTSSAFITHPIRVRIGSENFIYIRELRDSNGEWDTLSNLALRRADAKKADLFTSPTGVQFKSGVDSGVVVIDKTHFRKYVSKYNYTDYTVQTSSYDDDKNLLLVIAVDDRDEVHKYEVYEATNDLVVYRSADSAGIGFMYGEKEIEEKENIIIDFPTL